MNPFLLILWCGLAVFSQNVFAKEPAQSYMLDNGLKIIVQEDHRAPAVIVQVWYKVGAQDEFSGTTGIAHMLEHMMFKGTVRHPAGDYANKITEIGGIFNAETNSDYTMFYSLVASDHLEQIFELEADRMKSLDFKKQQFVPERSVVAEERRLRIDDNPNAVLLERLYAAAFLSTGYQHPAIGWMNDIKQFTLDDVKNWYRSWYGPNNAVVVVVGDVEPADVYGLAKHTFGALSPIYLSPKKNPAEQQPLGIRRLIVKRKSNLPDLMIGYLTPTLATAPSESDVYALYVLAKILGGTETSRLTQKLVRGQRKALEAVSDYSPLGRMSDLFMIEGIPATDSNVQELEQLIRQQITDLQTTPVEQKEIDRVKIAVTASTIYAQDSLDGQARALGLYEAIGANYQLDSQFVEKIQAVTPEQVQGVARKYLRDDALTVAVLEPTATQDSN